MSRKIRFEKMFNEAECSELIFCGPSDKDGTYAMCVGCPSCGEDIQVVLSAEEIEELHGALGRATGCRKTRTAHNSQERR